MEGEREIGARSCGVLQTPQGRPLVGFTCVASSDLYFRKLTLANMWKLDYKGMRHPDRADG